MPVARNPALGEEFVASMKLIFQDIESRIGRLPFHDPILATFWINFNYCRE